MLEAADYLNKKIKKLKRQTKFLSVEKVALLAGLEITNEMMNESNKETESKSKETNIETKKNTDVSEDSKKETVDESLSLKLVDEISELSKL